MKKKVLALLTVLVMVLSIVAVPNVSANADEAKGEINFANGYDWTNQSTQFYAFASASEEANAGTLTGQGVGFMGWFSGIVLERDENYNYVVKVVAPADGTNEAEAEPLGEGKIAIVWHSDAATAHPETAAFFAGLQVGDVLTASTYWENFAGAAGAQTTLSFTKATEGSVGPKAPTKAALGVVNGLGDVPGTSIVVLAPNNANVTLEVATTGSEFVGLPYWYSFVLEKDAAKGTWVVTASDLVASDNANACKDIPLGEGKMLVAIHDSATDTEALAFFKASATVGREYYLIGEIPTAEITAAGTALNDVYLSLEAPAPTPDPDPTPGEPGDEITPTGDFSTMGTTTLIMVSIALVSVALVLKKRNNVA